MFLRKTRSAREPLAVTMSGVRLGERVLQIGVGDARCVADCRKDRPHRHAAIVVPDDDAAVRIRRAVADVGALVDVRVVSEGTLPSTMRRSTQSWFTTTSAHDSRHAARAGDGCTNATALLRSGGRIVTIERGAPVGLRALFAADPKARQWQRAGTR